MKTIAETYLKRDPVNHADMLAVLDDAAVCYAACDGVVLHFDDIHFISAVDDAAALRLLPLITGDACVVAHNESLITPLCEQHGYRLLMRCCNHVYLHDQAPVVPLPEGVAIRPLTGDDLTAVLTHYHSISDTAYIAERLDAGMFGVTVRGELAGFIGTHTERSMGMLEVFPAFRRMGLASVLEAYLIERELAAGHVPFGQVLTDNTASINLQKKLGMTVGDRPVFWLGLREPEE